MIKDMYTVMNTCLFWTQKLDPRRYGFDRFHCNEWKYLKVLMFSSVITFELFGLSFHKIKRYVGCRGRDCMVVGFTTTVQSVPITTKVVSSNPIHDKVYSIQHYVIKFVSDLQQVGDFLRVVRFPPPIKLITTI
jgi:hypothetical protein